MRFQAQVREMLDGVGVGSEGRTLSREMLDGGGNTF